MPSALLIAVAGGCGGPAAPPESGRDLPHAGVRLTVACPDPTFARALAPMARAWAARTGAAVAVTADRPGDVAVVDFADLGTLADRGELVPVPAGLKHPNNPYQWLGILAAYQGEAFAGWGGQTFGIPLAGDAALVVYRADRLADPAAARLHELLAGQPLAPPATWEELADRAAFFAHVDRRPSLPALPADPARLAALFYRVAACYDRPARTASSADPPGEPPGDAPGFLFDPQTGAPRLDAAGFRIAADRLAALRRSAGPNPDPVAALLPADRGAVFAVVSLAELADLRARAGADWGRFGVAPLPGGRADFDPRTGEPRAPAGRPPGGDGPAPGTNAIPCVTAGRLGVVRTTCPHPDAAFDLLADLGGPARSVEIVGTPGLGAGPYREVHLERDRVLPWLAYGLDADRTAALQDAMRRFVNRDVLNPAYGPRGPDAAALNRLLGEELRKPDGLTPDGLRRAAAAWAAHDAGVPPAKRLEWRRRAAGLN